MRKGFRLQVLGYSLIFFLLSTVTCTLLPTFAADSTPSADIKSKLEELKNEIASKAAILKQEVNKKLKDKAYVGKVKQKSDTTLTLALDSGPKIVNINQDTQYESNVKGKKFSQKLISEEDYLASLGDVDETGVLTAKKIILLPIPNSEPKTYFEKTYLWGKVIAVSDQLATLKDRNSKNISVSLSGGAKVNDFVILTGRMGKNEIFDADFIYVIPQGGILKTKKVATPSAQVSTKSASPSAKKK